MNVPVTLLVFNRPALTRRIVEAVKSASPSLLLVVADGPRSDRPGEAEACQEVRRMILETPWPCEVRTNFAETNLGCRRRVSSGITWAFDQVEESIILEDDCLPTPSFFPFMEELLRRFRHDERVGMISGDNFLRGKRHTPYSYYFTRYTHIWGWGSWKRAWAKYDVDMSLWPEIRDNGWLHTALGGDPNLVRYWHDYFERMYEKGIDTWDYQWTFACLVHSMLAICPSRNLVTNIGFGKDATHTTFDSPNANLPSSDLEFPLQHPPFLIRDAAADRLKDYYVYNVPGSSDVVDSTAYKATEMREPVSNQCERQVTPQAAAELERLIIAATDEIEKNDPQAALAYLSEAKKWRIPVRGVDHFRALCFLALQKLGDARESLLEELRHFPENDSARALLEDVLREERKRAPRPQITNDAEFSDVLSVVRPYTMLPEPRLYSIFQLAKLACLEDLPGNFVECGVAGGGASAMIATIIQRYSRRPRVLFSCDSFEGMPAPSAHDTLQGVQADATGWGTGTCAAPEESLLEVSRICNVTSIIRPIKGYFEKTLPIVKSQIGEIAFMHADCDWYESNLTVFNNLYDQLVPGAYVQIDDYGYWDGVRKAITEFQGTHGIKLVINEIEGGAWFQKDR